MKAHSLFLVALLALPSVAAAEGTHPFSVHDMLAMDRIGDTRKVVTDTTNIRRTSDLPARRSQQHPQTSPE